MNEKDDGSYSTLDGTTTATLQEGNVSTWLPKCPKCVVSYSTIPINWDCPSCGSKTWQPDAAAPVCQRCASPVAAFSRHHCRACGLVVCDACAQYNAPIPKWHPRDKHRICGTCAKPSHPLTISGYMEKLGERKGLFGASLKRRWFELRGTALSYFKEKGEDAVGIIDIDGARPMETAMYSSGFIVTGPKLQRAYVLRCADDALRSQWMAAIAKTSNAANDDNEQSEMIINKHPGDVSELSISAFDLQTVIGLGSFGRVVKCTEKRTGSTFAIKILDKHQVVSHKMVDHIKAEKKIMAEIDHPFVCKLHYAFQTKRNLCIVLDFLSGGELFFHLQRSRRFSEGRARLYAAQIGLALDYIHSKNIIYRDLKPENLVLDCDGNVVLTDFGLAKMDVTDITHTFCGTPEYMAPELIKKKGHTKAVDWWSLGVFLYEMIHGSLPYYSTNVNEMYDLILHKPLVFPQSFSHDLRDLLTQLLDRDPATRMQTGEAFMAHSFFRGMDWDAVYERRVKPEFVPDLTGNELKYIDKAFTKEKVNVQQLSQPNDPSDPLSPKFAGFEYSPSSPKMTAQQSPPNSPPSQPSQPAEEVVATEECV